MNTNPLPNIIKNAEYDLFLQKLCKTNSRMDDLDRALEWGVIRDHAIFSKLRDNLYLGKISPGGPFGSVRIIYEWIPDSGVITFINAESCDEE